METTLKNNKSEHIGYNVRRIREISGKKQYELAEACGLTQKQLSRLENSESINDRQLKVISEKLGVTSEFIRNFRDEPAIKIVQHDITLQDNATKNYLGYQNINNPVDEFIEFFEKFIQKDKNATQSIEKISKSVLNLTEEIKKAENKSE
jgi:transcriptional regulator with XRE-family HTH domain